MEQPMSEEAPAFDLGVETVTSPMKLSAKKESGVRNRWYDIRM